METARTLPTEGSLIRRLPAKQENLARHAIWFAAFLLLLTAIFIALALLAWFGEGWLGDEESERKLREKLFSNPLQLVVLVLAIPLTAVQMLFLHYGRKGERLNLTQTGISYHFPLPRWLSLFKKEWRMSWGRIKEARVSLMLGTVQPLLVLSDGRQRRRLLIFNWVAPDEPDPFPRGPSLRRPTFEDVRVRIENSALICALRGHGVEVKFPDGRGAGTCDLTQNPLTLGATVMILGFGFYGLIDLLLLKETYTAGYPWAVSGGCGATAAVIAYLWLTRARFPQMESLALAVLLGGAVGFAAYPGLLRVNQLTDTDGLRRHEYVLVDYVRLIPRDEGLPTVRLSGHDEYWMSFKRGSRHVLWLRRGGLGFYQLDLGSLRDAMREFYEEYYAKRRVSRR